MSDGHGHGHDSIPVPQPIGSEPVGHVVEAAPIPHSDRVDVLHLTGADGAGYSVVLPLLRSARPTPETEDTELTE